MLLNWTKRNTALWLAGSASTIPTYFMLGSGSGTIASTDTTLFKPMDRQAVTSTNGNTLNKVAWQGDWNSVELSGLQLTEWGMCLSGAVLTGSMWSKSVIPAINFDGTNELQILETWEVY